MTEASSDSLAAIREQFIATIGQLTQADGLTRNAGRIFALLLFDGESVSFGELAEQLQISRGGVSSSTRTLEERGLIKRTGKIGDRQDYFQLADAPYCSFLRRTYKRKVQDRQEIEKLRDALPSMAEGAWQRINDYVLFHQRLEQHLVMALDGETTAAVDDTIQS